ncbi:MAG TPA: DUF420 domain-containing protein [Pirellulales bacterium]|nr:DUF420 domain-containing protein [Pirellulales bacterium]
MNGDGSWLAVHNLPAVNASLNATATLLLLVGYWLIKQRRETAHKWTMVSALVVSVLFLGCYLVYHFQAGSVPFTDPSPVRYVYYAILLSHVLLAFTVPVLALVTTYLGFADRRAAHRRWAWWTWPIWLYVSITGVVIYVMLYHLWPSSALDSIMRHSS